MEYLLEITYFKKFFQMMIKSIVYHNITKNIVTYKKRDEENDNIMKNYFNNWDSFSHINKLFNKINNMMIEFIK